MADLIDPPCPWRRTAFPRDHIHPKRGTTNQTTTYLLHRMMETIGPDRGCKVQREMVRVFMMKRTADPANQVVQEVTLLVLDPAGTNP